MRYKLIVLVVYYQLWSATSSQTDDYTSCDFHCHMPMVMKDPLSLTCDEEGMGSVMVHCGNTDTPQCNVSITNFCNQYTTTSPTKKTTIPEELKPCETSESKSTSGVTTIDNGFSTGNSPNSIVVATLGALVGLLLVILIIVTAVLVWTCWLLKRRGGLKFNSKRQIRSSTDTGQLVNPIYEGDDLLRLHPGPAPTYETIPPHPRIEAKLEIIEEGESVLKREERANLKTTIRLETIFEASKEESYSKLEFKEESSTNKKVSQECITEYSNLETVTIKSSVPKDMDDTTSDSNYNRNEENEKEKSAVDGNTAFDDNGYQEGSGDVEKRQGDEAEIKLPVISISLDTGNKRGEPETSTTETE